MSNWEVEVLLGTYVDEIKPYETEEYDYEKNKIIEEITELYVEAIIRTVENRCGIIMPIDMAIDWVSRGSIIDYDGHGFLITDEGEKEYIECSVSFLEEAKEKGVKFVSWYNK